LPRSVKSSDFLLVTVTNRDDKMKIKIIAGMISLLLVIGGGYYLRNRTGDHPSDRTAQRTVEAAARKQSVPVVLTPVSIRDFEDCLTVQGKIEAKNNAMVSARIGGTIETIFVDEGDKVVAGETRLFQIDALKLEKAKEVSRVGLAVAQAAERERQANLERVEAEFEKAEIDYERAKRLHKVDAMTLDAFENQESRYKQTTALLKHAHTLVELAVEQKRQAELAFAMAEKDLSDSLVLAPIDGWVTQRLQEPGESANVGVPILRIEDTTLLEVSAHLPAQHYARVQAGETLADISVYDTEVPGQTITYKSPTINPQMPTFEMKCVIDDPPEGVVPNAMAQVTVYFSREKGLGVPSRAIQVRGATTTVFVVENNQAHKVEVETGLETDGWTAIASEQLPEGTPVVSSGQFLLEEGTPVSIQEGGI